MRSGLCSGINMGGSRVGASAATAATAAAAAAAALPRAPPVVGSAAAPSEMRDEFHVRSDPSTLGDAGARVPEEGGRAGVPGPVRVAAAQVPLVVGCTGRRGAPGGTRAAAVPVAEEAALAAVALALALAAAAAAPPAAAAPVLSEVVAAGSAADGGITGTRSGAEVTGAPLPVLVRRCKTAAPESPPALLDGASPCDGTPPPPPSVASARAEAIAERRSPRGAPFTALALLAPLPPPPRTSNTMGAEGEAAGVTSSKTPPLLASSPSPPTLPLPPPPPAAPSVLPPLSPLSVLMLLGFRGSWDSGTARGGGELR